MSRGQGLKNGYPTNVGLRVTDSYFKKLSDTKKVLEMTRNFAEIFPRNI